VQYHVKYHVIMPFKFPFKGIKKEIEQLPHFLTIKQAADFLQVDYFTIYRLVIIGEIEATKVAGCWRIPRSSLLEYLERRHPFNWEDSF